MTRPLDLTRNGQTRSPGRRGLNDISFWNYQTGNSWRRQKCTTSELPDQRTSKIRETLNKTPAAKALWSIQRERHTPPKMNAKRASRPLGIYGDSEERALWVRDVRTHEKPGFRLWRRTREAGWEESEQWSPSTSFLLAVRSIRLKSSGHGKGTDGTEEKGFLIFVFLISSQLWEKTKNRSCFCKLGSGERFTLMRTI